MAKTKSIEERLDALLIRVDNLETENAQLRHENHALKDRLSNFETKKNSKNSSKPPSSDFPKVPKTKTLRKSSGKKPGAQSGHKGTTLRMVQEPTIVQHHYSDYCTNCGKSLSNIKGVFSGKRQVIDIPPIQPVITEHQIHSKQCSCGKVNPGSYPENVITPVSYGVSVQSLASYMHARQFMPYERLREFFNTIFGLKISTGGINYLIGKFSAKVLPYYEQIRDKVRSQRVIGADETGTNINGKLHWAWVFQNDQATFLSINKKRGYNALEEIMPEDFKRNILVTDCWRSYFKTEADSHQLCTAHLLRELEFFIQKYPGNTWSSTLKSLITEAINLHKDNCQDEEKITQILKNFGRLLDAEIDENLNEVVAFKKRMIKYGDYVFAFLKNPEIPPDNNASERAVRNFKVKQKVSGFFKSDEGADSYAILRSIIDTAIKKVQNPFDVLHAIAVTN